MAISVFSASASSSSKSHILLCCCSCSSFSLFSPSSWPLLNSLEWTSEPGHLSQLGYHLGNLGDNSLGLSHSYSLGLRYLLYLWDHKWGLEGNTCLHLFALFFPLPPFSLVLSHSLCLSLSHSSSDHSG